jgi:hypothetical protein
MKAQPKPPKVLFRKYPLTVPILGSALLVAGGALVFWLLTKNRYTPGSLPVGANVVPQEALMVLSVSTDVGQWQQLRQFGTPKSQAAFDRTLVQWRDQTLTRYGLNYAQDIQPWVGSEVTIAQLASQSEILPGNTSNLPTRVNPQPLLVVLPIADPVKAQALLSKPQSPLGQMWTERVYKDIKIRQAPPGSAAELQIAVLENRLVVVGNSARSLEQAIDAYRSRQSLAQTPGYVQALSQIQIQQPPFFSLYRNIPASVTSAAENLNQSLSKQRQDWIRQSQGWATVAHLKPEGIELRNIAWLKPNSQRKFAVKNDATLLPQRLPASTIALISGSDFKQFWEDYNRDYVTYPVQPINPELLRQGIQGSIGLDWNKDFLPWLQGEFALAVIPMPGNAAAKMPVGIVAMAQVSDRRAAEASWEKLDQAMASRQKYRVKAGKFNNKAVVNWSDPISGTTVTHGWLDHNIAFLSLGTPVTGTILPQTRTPLAKDGLFTQATLTANQSNPTAVNGYFFVNFERILSLSTLPPLLQWINSYRDWLEGIRGIGLSAVTSSDRTSQFNIMVLLKQGNSPAPLPSPTQSAIRRTF